MLASRYLRLCVVLVSLGLVTSSICGDEPTTKPTEKPTVDANTEKGPLFVAVGYALRRLTSSDGIHWQHEQAVPEHADDKAFLLRGVTYGKRRIVAVGGSRISRILVSESFGREWQDVSIEQNFVSDVAFGNDQFVAVGYQRSLRSSDGYKWLAPVRLGEVSWRRIEFGNGRFVAIGASGPSNAGIGWCGATEDGVQWTQTKVSDEHVPHAIAFGNGRFVIAGNHGLRQSSRDGQTWEHRTLGAADETLLDLIWTGSEFIATGNRGAYASADGETWQRRELRSPSRLVFGAGRYVGCSAGRFSHSTDGIRWTPVDTQHKLSITKIIYIPER
jgi:hypothetical protein